MRGAAPYVHDILTFTVFLLTRLMRGAAQPLLCGNGHFAISTHAPHARRGSALRSKATD